MPGKLQSFHVTCECETLQLIPVVLCNLKQEILVWNNGVPQGFILGPTLSLHSWRRVLTPLFYKDLPPYIAYSSFFKFCPTPTALSVVLFLWLNGWSRHIWCTFLLNDIMDLPVCFRKKWVHVWQFTRAML